jgi:hypothetical protein
LPELTRFIKNHIMKTTIQTAIALALLSSSAVHAQQAVQWKVSDGGNGHWYLLITPPDRINVGDAATAAIQRGGDLASVGSTAENQFVFALAAATPSLWTIVWTGATQISGPWIGAHYVDGAWQWSDGNAWDFANWSTGNPNYLPGESAVLYMGEANGPPTNMWNNIYPNYLNWGYVIEWSADCNSDGIVDYRQCHDGTLPDYNGNNIPDCCERGEACVVGNYPVQWRVEDGGNGHWYQLKRRSAVVSWASASEESVSLGGHLASILSEAEDVFVFSVADHPGAWQGYLGPWLGGWQVPGTGEPLGIWRWSSGEPWGYVGPDSTFPNNGGPPGTDENRLHYIDFVRKWNDLPENGAPENGGGVRAFVIEWSADCNNDNIVDYGQILQGQLADANTNGIPDICEGPTCNDIDLNLNGIVDGGDLGVLLAFWGTVSPAFPRADINGDGLVNGADLGIVLAFWGPCPG